MMLRRPNLLPAEEQLDMAPMVDVVFQLMTFLLITFNATVTAGVDLPEARSGRGVGESESFVLSVEPAAAPGGEVKVYDGPNPGPERLLGTSDAIRAAVERAVAEGRVHIVLQAAGDVPEGEVLKIAGAVGEVPGVLLHIGVDEPDP